MFQPIKIIIKKSKGKKNPKNELELMSNSKSKVIENNENKREKSTENNLIDNSYNNDTSSNEINHNLINDDDNISHKGT